MRFDTAQFQVNRDPKQLELEKTEADFAWPLGTVPYYLSLVLMDHKLLIQLPVLVASNMINQRQINYVID